MAPIAISSPISNDDHTNTYSAIDEIKARLQRIELAPPSAISVKLQETFDLTKYSSFQSTPAIGTEFRAYSPDGRPVLSIRDILGDETRLKALGKLV